MILRVKSLKAPTYDSSFIDVPFTLTVIPWPCTPLITPPTLQMTYNYYIKDPPVPMDIPFLGVNNNDCFFQSVLDPPPPGPIFTFTPAHVPADPIIDTKWTTLADPFLTVVTNDISLHVTV